MKLDLETLNLSWESVTGKEFNHPLIRWSIISLILIHSFPCSLCFNHSPILYNLNFNPKIRSIQIRSQSSSHLTFSSVMTGFGTRVSRFRDLLHTSAFVEYRGTSFALGGDEDVTTLSNIFGLYSENIRGASTGNHSWEVGILLFFGGVGGWGGFRNFTLT